MDAKTENLLDAPLDPRRVMKREGSGGHTFDYLKTHDVKRTANKIFGYDGWSYVVQELECLGFEDFTTRNKKQGIRVGYRAVVVVTVGDVQRGDVGYGDAMEYNGSTITPHELASKEAVSDAIKRCLSSWGDQFGLVLYGADPAPQEAPANSQEAARPEPRKVSKSQQGSAGTTKAERVATPPPPAADPPPETPTAPSPVGDKINAWQITELKKLVIQLRSLDPFSEEVQKWDDIPETQLVRGSAEGAREWIDRLKLVITEVKELGPPVHDPLDGVPG